MSASPSQSQAILKGHKNFTPEFPVLVRHPVFALIVALRLQSAAPTSGEPLSAAFSNNGLISGA